MIMSVMVKLANVIQVIVQDWSLIRVDSEYTGGYKSDKCWKSLGKDDRTDVQYKNKNSGKKKRLTIEHCDYDATVKLQNSNCGNTVQINVLYWVVQHGIRGICDLFQEFKKQSGIETCRLMKEPNVMTVNSGNTSRIQQEVLKYRGRENRYNHHNEEKEEDNLDKRVVNVSKRRKIARETRKGIIGFMIGIVIGSSNSYFYFRLIEFYAVKSVVLKEKQEGWKDGQREYASWDGLEKFFIFKVIFISRVYFLKIVDEFFSRVY